MQHKFIQTTNYINCLEAMKELARLPRDMEKMGLFYGNAGRGKSLIIEKLAIDEGAALVVFGIDAVKYNYKYIDDSDIKKDLHE